MKKMLGFLAAVVAMTGAANAAFAPPTTFYTTSTGFYYYGTGGGYSGYQEYTKHGLTMTVHGATYNDNNPQEITGSAPTQVWGSGTGIDRGYYDGHQVDGNKTNEAVVIKFDQKVKLISAKFSYVNGPSKNSDGDDIDIFVEDLSNLGNLIYDSGEWDIHSGNNPFNFEDQLGYALIGSLFGLGADGKNDAWKLKAITVAKHIPEIPVPAALPLFLAGLGTIGWAKKRRKSA